MRELLVCARAGVALVALAACAPDPSFGRVQVPLAAVPAGHGRVVIVWPPTTCDAGGAYALASTGGLELGDVTPGTWRDAILPEGEHVLFAWSPAREVHEGTELRGVGVVRARVDARTTTVVRVAFGEWGLEGPRVARDRRGMRVCAGRHPALVAVRDADPEALAAWTEELEHLPTRVAAAPASAERADDVAVHAALAVQRFARLTPEARALATTP